MNGAELSTLVGPALASALATKGYDTLTPVQQAVLDESLEGRDLRITSQTGSGKTLAIGFAVRDLVDEPLPHLPGPPRPRVLILAPTRELARQIGEELSWLYAPLRARVAVVTGGAGYLDQRRELSSNPVVVVATPGRLRDALERGKIDAASLAAVVLDEADSMLDLGFRDDLDAILAKLPEERRSHLVSATFSRDVLALADRFQREPAHVEGTRLGDAHADIEHVVHLVEPSQRIDALVNLLLWEEDAKSLVFARTRADVARIAGELTEAGFVVRTLSGEMEQPERDRALAAFREGGVQAMVATDVAARGIDVRDIARVIQVEPPSDVETYTHRSGRTGRAGRQGTSVLFVSPSHYPVIARGLDRAKIAYRVDPIPRPDEIQRAREEKLVAWLGRDEDDGAIDPHAVSIADRILQGPAPARSIARLVARAGLQGPTEARDVRRIAPPAPPRADRGPKRDRSGPSHAPRREPPPSARETRELAVREGPAHARETEGPAGREAPPYPLEARGPHSRGRGEPPPHAKGKPPSGAGWVTFRMTWGADDGADARRVLAAACRRGQIRGGDVGAIRIEPDYSLIDVSTDVAESFASAAARPDPRDRGVHIARDGVQDERPPRDDARAPRPRPHVHGLRSKNVARGDDASRGGHASRGGDAGRGHTGRGDAAARAGDAPPRRSGPKR